MRRCRFVLFAACLLLSGHSWASAAVRVAIVPPTFSEGESSREGATLGDYLQVKLHGLPDVDWIERGDLDKILGEAKLKVLGDQGVSGVVLGRLLKATSFSKEPSKIPRGKARATRKGTPLV